MRRRSLISATDPNSPWTYQETIDEATSAIEVRGFVNGLAADLLRGTIEELHRRGHRHITVTVEHPGRIDTRARAVLDEVALDLEGRQGRLTILWSTDEDGGRPRAATG